MKRRGPVCKLCRREGKKLFLKGYRCTTSKCSFERRKYPPGQHGLGRIRLTEYGRRMREKQSARKMFGISERQFRKYFEEASKKRGTTGALLLQFLERRLDNVAFRLGYASSRRAASQLVSHGNVLVNGRKVNIPSFRVKEKMVISLNPKLADKLKSFVLETTPPGWLLRDEADLSGKIVRLPAREDAEQAIEESMIVEYYSK